MKPAIAYLAAVAVHEDIPELEAFVTRWQAIGYRLFPIQTPSQGCRSRRRTGENPFYDKLAARLAAE